MVVSDLEHLSQLGGNVVDDVSKRRIVGDALSDLAESHADQLRSGPPGGNLISKHFCRPTYHVAAWHILMLHERGQKTL